MSETDDRLAQIAARCEAAMPGPWAWDNRGERDIQVGIACDGDDTQLEGLIVEDDETVYVEGIAGYVDSTVDAEFIAHARTDIPWLLVQLAAANCRADEQQALAEEAVQALRPVVWAFALEMERELRSNDFKGGWHNEDTTVDWLLGRLREELLELQWCVEDRYGHSQTQTLSEAADLANFAMMVADIVCAPPRPALLTTDAARQALERRQAEQTENQRLREALQRIVNQEPDPEGWLLLPKAELARLRAALAGKTPTP